LMKKVYLEQSTFIYKKGETCVYNTIQISYDIS